eukprot:CAMPEP_0118640910 /NCGR_PEP_ID=MMETSP0785-20121206/4998_1 /TAXON_ID=91992 /ORGANISM="Bolidomonas pacifica, Strain CCMP 1866" /LENGTH=55 /DNA_ID=CAMNT_0006532315 /DNA_START=45 /DNA_END=212 /DNA_ORIENTATION=+
MKDVDGLIPGDAERQTGRRKEELEAEAKGVILFNRNPIVPPAGQGELNFNLQVRE